MWRLKSAGIMPRWIRRCARRAFGGTVCQAGAIAGNAAELWLGREFLMNSLRMIVPRGNGAMEYRAESDYPLWDQYRVFDTIVSMMKQDKLTVTRFDRPARLYRGFSGDIRAD